MKTEKIMEKIVFASAIISVLAVALITIFIFISGMPSIKEHGIAAFILGDTWSPTNNQFGLLPLISGSISVTLGALVIGVPIGISCSIMLAEVLSKRQSKLIKSAIELLAGIPSVVYGFFGVSVLVPAIRKIATLLNPNFEGTGFSILAGSIVLAVMILPTIVSISENAISKVPKEYKEGSLALGADKRETVLKVILPAAKSGIFSGVVLGMGRAIGETMAVLLITGNVASVPKSVLDSVATLTGTIAMEMSYATLSHQQALFVVGIVLFVIIVILNGIAQGLMRRFGG